MRQYIKPLLGIVLIIISIVFACYWENEGRELFTTQEVYVASKFIYKGEILDSNNIKVARVLNENIVEGAVLYDDTGAFFGKKANYNISCNTQITKDMYKKSDTASDKLTAIEIKGEWIYSISQSIRNGDRVCVYTTENEYIGDYAIGFVRDKNGAVIYEDDLLVPADLWERGNSTGYVEYVELMGLPEDYFKLYNIAVNEERQFVILQKRVDS